MTSLLRRGVNVVTSSVQRDGFLGTLRKAGKFGKYLRGRLESADYYTKYWAAEREDGFDAKYGTDTSQMVEGFELDATGPHAKLAVRYEPARVKDVERALASLQVDHAGFTLVDLGSGKGRTLMLASQYPFKMLVGVEMSPGLHTIALKNIDTFRAAGGKGEFELRCADAASFEPPPGDLVYYLFNPFAAPVLEEVVKNLEDSLRATPRKAAMLYVFPAHRDVVERSGVFKVQREDPRFTLFANW